MRVLVIGDRLPDYFADNFLTCLEDAGHVTASVAPFSGALAHPGRPMPRVRDALHQLPRFARRTHAHVLHAAEGFSPDLVVNLDYRLTYSLIDDLRSAARGAAVVFWFPDSPGSVRQETHLLAGYDALFLKDSVQVDRYRRAGFNAHALAQGCNPRWHRPTGPLAETTDAPTVVVAGNMYASRFALLQQLAREGVRLQIHGSAWPRWLPRDPSLQAAYSGHTVVREAKARAFREASVVLNNVVTHEADRLNARLFEAAACGAVVLTEFRDRLPELFRVGQEVATYSAAADLAAEVRRLGAMPQHEREAMAAAASARAHREHTYAHRFDAMLAAVGSG